MAAISSGSLMSILKPHKQGINIPTHHQLRGTSMLVHPQRICPSGCLGNVSIPWCSQGNLPMSVYYQELQYRHKSVCKLRNCQRVLIICHDSSPGLRKGISAKYVPAKITYERKGWSAITDRCAETRRGLIPCRELNFMAHALAINSCGARSLYFSWNNQRLG